MLTVVSSVPRVETKLYPNEGGSAPSKPNLSPAISSELLQSAKAKVAHAFTEHTAFTCIYIHVHLEHMCIRTYMFTCR